MIFVVSCVFFNSLIVFKLFEIFIISMNSSELFLLYVETYGKGSSLLIFFLGGGSYYF